MIARNPEPRPGRNLRRLAVIGFGLLALLLLAGWYVSSDRFQERVRRTVVADLESVTGGRAELGSFRWKLSRLEFEARDLTIHGLEAPGEVPYARIDRLLVRPKIISLFRRQIGLRYVEAERPVIHIRVYKDGTTNQPVPKGRQQGGRSAVERLFDLAIDRLEVRNGQLLWNDQRLPLDFTGNSLVAGMSHHLLEKRYDGEVSIGSVAVKYQDFRPLESKAEIGFSLWPGRAELKSLKWSSAGSRLEASGRLADFNDPKIDLTYSGTLDLTELGGVARMSRLHNGKLEINGQGAYSAQSFSAAGKLLLQNAEWRDAGLRVAGVNASAQFSLTRGRLLLTNLVGRALGGAISGSADIHNWSSVQGASSSRRAPAAAGASASLQQGSAHLALDRIQVAAVAAAFSTSSLPLGGIHAAGMARGTLEATWAGSPSNGEAAMAFEVEPPSRPAAGELPLSGRLRLLYRVAPQVLEVSQLDLATRATRLNASGVLGSSTAKLNVALSTTDLGELQPALEAFHQPRIPMGLGGRASFTGSVSGRLATPTIAGRLEVSDFDSMVALSPPRPGAAPAAGPPRMHWDLLTADVQYSPARVSVRNAVLRRGAAQVSFDFSASLRQGRFEDSSPVSARVNVRNADLADLQTLAGYDYPVTGRMSLQVSAAGTRADARGDGSLQVSGGTIYKESFAQLRAEIHFAGGEVQFNRLTLTRNGASIVGSLAYNPGSQAFRLDLRGSHFELAGFPRLQTEKLSIAGLAGFHAEGSGTLDAPVVNADFSLQNVVLNGEAAGNFEAHAITRGAELHLTVRSHLQSAEFALDGDIRLRQDFPASVRLRFAHLDIDPLIRAYLQGRITGHSSVAGNIDLRGPLRQPRKLAIAGVIDQFSAEVEKFRLSSDGPVRFALADQVFTLDRLRLTGAGTDITAGGSVQLGGAREINLRADGQVNLKIVQTFVPDLASEGMTEIAVRVRGVLSKPEMAGRVRVTNGAISYADLPNGLTNLNGSLVFNEGRLQVEKLTARTGGGTLNLGGYISWAKGLVFNLTATSRDIRLRYPPGVSAMADADLRLAGSTSGSLLSGDITITRFGVNPRFDFAAYLARSKQPPSMTRPDSPLNNLRFDVRIVTTPELRVETSLAKISGNADLHLRGTAARPSLLGRVDIVEGDIFFNGTRYRLERGDITFISPVRIEPVLNLDATARVRDYDVTFGFHGPVDRLGTTYRSDPPLPTGDIIALLALGRTREETVLSTRTTQPFTETASNLILSEALNSAVSSRTQRLFGVSRIKIDPQAGGPENNPNARVTIEQQVSNNVTLTFITNLAQSAQQIIQLEYNINRRLSVIAVRDQNGVLGFDIRYRHRRK